MVEVAKCVTYNKVLGIFGFKNEDYIAKVGFPPVQCRQFHHFHSFLQAKKENLLCLIPCAIDQDPYFRMMEDVAPRIGYNKPTLFESSFFPALQGEYGKMFSTSAIYVTDSAKDIKNKVDISVKYLNFFLDDDSELEHIKKEYGVGLMLTGEVKQRLIQALTEIVERHRKARAAVTDELTYNIPYDQL